MDQISSVLNSQIDEALKKENGQKSQEIEKSIRNFNSHIPLNPTLLEKFLSPNAYNSYLLRGWVRKSEEGQKQKRQVQDTNGNNLFKAFQSKHTLDYLPFRPILNQKYQIFHNSTDSQSKNEKFVPDISKENTDQFIMAHYVPVEGEKWRKKNGGQAGKEGEKTEAIKPFEYGNNGQKEPLFKPLMEYYQKEKFHE